jgi:nuclear pore complex protein Nup133
VVIPTTGKVTYWESIASAATLDLIRQQRNGVETTIQGMLSGEAVIDVLNAESAGFILAFSTGRLAYMSVRDGQGRPAISVQFLRGGNGPSSGGIFGSIRNALVSHSLRGDIAAVRAERPDKVGERNIVVATAKGKIQSWNIHRGGHTALLAETDARETIVLAIKDTQSALRNLLMETFEVIDFTYAPKPLASTQMDDQREDGVHLLVLVSLTDRHACRYSLVEVVLKKDEFGVKSTRPINSYETPISRNATAKPRLYLPNPARVAYIVFDKAVVVLSMAKQPESPDAQLRIESHLSPQVFEDVVDFRGDINVEIVGSGMEEPQGPSHGIEDSKSRRYKAKHPAAVLLVRGGGVVRVAATNTDKLISNDAQQVTAKSKLEQAVFFGTLEKNPLSFAVRPELQFTPEEVGAAALELSLEISKSQTPYIPTTLSSIEMNLRKRSAALQHLAEHLQMTGVSLDRTTRWKLLWNAEKVEAATTIWKSYDANLRTKPEGEKRGLLTDLVESIHEDYKSNPVSEAGELDRVRHWFINDIWDLEIAVPWAYQVLKHRYQDGRNDHNAILQTTNEADDILIGALETAFRFREENLNLYGLGADKLEYGVLKIGYEGLPEFWTSTFFIVANVRKEADLAIALVKEYWKNPAKAQKEKIDIELLKRVRLNISKIVDLSVRSSTERIRWIATQNSPELQIQAEEIQATQTSAQDDQITSLADIDLGDDAIAIAEKHQIFPTLATVIMMEVNTCAGSMQRTGIDDEEFEYFSSRASLLEERIRQYFINFGESWATAFYEYDIEAGAMANLLECFQEQRPFLTKFLRSKPEYAKLAWVHEVGREENFDRAAQMLLDLGLRREQDLWSKKIELSMGKLAHMAGRKYSQANGILIPDGGQLELIATGEHLGLIKIQDRVYDHVFPSIRDALDEKAEIQLALEAHGNKDLKQQRSFFAFLEESLGHLVRHESMDALTLIDLLTLMDGGAIPEEESQEEADFRSDQFYLALQASCYGISNKDEQTSTQRLVWRRCFLKDDWAVVNNTELKDDQAVNDQLRTTTMYWTFRACLKNRKFYFRYSNPLQD